MAIAALLVAYLALFPALFALVLHAVLRRYGARGLLLAPAAWVASEYGRLALFGGFPWVLLGYSQVPVLPVAQLASVTGVFGLSGLLAAAATSLAWLVVGRGRSRVTAPLATLLAIALVVAWGEARLSDNRLVTEGRPLRVGLVQGNVAQNDKWEPAMATDIFRRYLRLTRQALDGGARLVVWPESATPFYFGAPGPESQMLSDLARTSGAAMLIGSDQWEPGAGATPPRVYNAAFLLKADGRVGGVYRKMHLVPFGEYVPLKSLLFFVEPAGRGRVGLLARHRASRRFRSAAAGMSASPSATRSVYPALIGRAFVGGQRAADDDHQRCVVRPVVGAVPALRAGRASRGRGGPLPRAGGQHRHQRQRSIPTGACCSPRRCSSRAPWVADVRLLDGRTIYSRTRRRHGVAPR